MRTKKVEDLEFIRAEREFYLNYDGVFDFSNSRARRWEVDKIMGEPWTKIFNFHNFLSNYSKIGSHDTGGEKYALFNAINPVFLSNSNEKLWAFKFSKMITNWVFFQNLTPLF